MRLSLSLALFFEALKDKQFGSGEILTSKSPKISEESSIGSRRLRVDFSFVRAQAPQGIEDGHKTALLDQCLDLCI